MDSYLKCENLGGLAGIYPEVAIFRLTSIEPTNRCSLFPRDR